MSGRIRTDLQDPPEQPQSAARLATAPPEPRNAGAPEPPPAPSGEGGAPPAATPPEPEQTPEQLAQRRIDRLTWERHAERRRADELEARLRQLEQRPQPQQTTTVPPYGPPDPAAAEQRGYERRLQQERQERFDQGCNTLYRAGQAEYGAQAMDEAVRMMTDVGWSRNPDALEQLTEVEHSHKVYQHLAQNPDEAYRVLSLAPNARMKELTRLSDRNAPQAVQELPRNVSRAPAPLRTVSGSSRPPDKPLEKMTIGDFIRTRDRDSAGPSYRIRR